MTESLVGRAKRLADEYAGCATTMPLVHAKRTELHAAIDALRRALPPESLPKPTKE